MHTRIFIQKLNQCKPTSGTDVIIACEPYTWIDGITYASSNDSATFILTNAAGCDSVVTMDLSIPIIDDSITLSHHTLTAHSSTGTFQWIDCDSGTITGDTAQSFTPTVNGNYAVIVTENGCPDTSACVAITTVSLEEDPASALRIFPNPSKDGKFSIQYAGRIEGIQVYDLTGRLVQEQSGAASTLNLEGFPSGIYIIRLRLGRGMVLNQEVLVE